MKYSNKNIKHIYPGEAPKLPDEYQEVEWLQSDGNAYIDTGVKPTISDIITSVFKGTFNANTSNVIYSSVYGGWNASPNNWFMLRFYQSSTDYSLNVWHRIGDGTKIYLKPAKKIDNTNIHTVVVSQRDNQCTINIDGVSESITVSSGAIESDQPNYWLLSYIRTSEPVETGNTIKLYRWTLQHNNDILVRDFVPCYRKSDNEPGMYDLVNKVFYTNAGSGDFTVGNDVIYKKVGIIVDSQGRTIFSDPSNLFLGYNSEWSINAGIAIATGSWGSSNTGDNRLVFFFNCKPNTTYRYTATEGGDRFCIFALNASHDTPPVHSGGYPYGASSSDIHTIENRNTAQINATKNYTFTTGANDRMVYIYCALSTRPTGIYVREV